MLAAFAIPARVPSIDPASKGTKYSLTNLGFFSHMLKLFKTQIRIGSQIADRSSERSLADLIKIIGGEGLREDLCARKRFCLKKRSFRQSSRHTARCKQVLLTQ